MANLKLQRRLAASILKVGLDRIKFDPERLNEIKEAITRADIRELIKDKAIIKLPAKGYARRAGRRRQLRKRKGRRRGPGKIKKYVVERKRNYIILIRNLRAYLKALKNRHIISSSEYKILRKRAKSGAFKSKKELVDYIKLTLGRKI
ncbi:MAG: 50S ribosomal protein L19e [Candidatus Pacearchaeota archaeon]